MVILARPLAVVLAPALVALLVVYLLNPIVTGLARRGVQVSGFVAAEENRSAIAAVLATLSGFARSALTLVLGLTIGPVVAFYVLADLPNLLTKIRRLIPPDRRAEVEQVAWSSA